MQKLYGLMLDLLAIGGIAAVFVGADQLGQAVGVGRSLGWLWLGLVAIGVAILAARSVALRSAARRRPKARAW